MKRAATLCLLASVLVAVPAAAEPPQPIHARLDYDRSRGGATCPDVSFFRDVVAGRFGGRDPFTSDAARRITLTVHRVGPYRFVASAVMYDEAGSRLGSRDLFASDCTSAVEAMGVTMNYWLGPLLLPEPVAVAPAAPAEPSPPAPPQPTPAREPVPVPVPVTRQRPMFVLTVGPHLAFTTLPGSVAPGFAGSVGVQWPRFSLNLEAGGDAPAAATATPPYTGRVRESLLFGSVAPCFHAGIFVGCGLLSAGALISEVTGTAVSSARFPYVALGARLGLEFPLAPHLALRLAGDVLGTLKPLKASFDKGGTWTMPRVGETLSVRVVISY